MDLRGATAFAWGLLATLLFLEALRAFFASVYYHNLSALGLNATALYAVLLLAPVVFLLPRRRLPARPLLIGATALLVAGRLGMNIAWGTPAYLPLTGISAAAFLIALPAFLSACARGEGARAGLGVVLAAALDAALLLAGRSDDVTVRPAMTLGVLVVGAALLALTLRAPRSAEPARPTRPHAPLALMGAGLAAWLYLNNATWGSPFALASWNGMPLALAVPAVLAGPAFLLALSIRGATLSRGAFWLLQTVVLLAALDHGLVHSPALPVLVLFAQAALALDVVLLVGALARAPWPQAGRALAATGLVLLLLHFAFAFSFTFAYVPLGAFWHGAERFLPLVATALIVLAAAPAPAPLLRIPNLPRAAALITALLLLAPVVASFAPPTKIATPQGAEVRIASFNVHQGFDNTGTIHPEAMTRVLQDLDADIVALQESDTPRFTSANLDIVHHLAGRLGYHAYRGPPTSEQGVGMALLSRYPIEDARWVRLPTNTDNRFTIEARVQIAEQSLWIYVVHFGLEQPDRESQLTDLLELSETKTPHVLIGDFNSCPTGHCPDYDGPKDNVYARLANARTDAWVATGHETNAPIGHTFPAWAPDQRIDHIWVTADVQVLGMERVRTEEADAASDHLPIVADIRVG